MAALQGFQTDSSSSGMQLTKSSDVCLPLSARMIAAGLMPLAPAAQAPSPPSDAAANNDAPSRAQTDPLKHPAAALSGLSRAQTDPLTYTRTQQLSASDNKVPPLGGAAVSAFPPQSPKATDSSAAGCYEAKSMQRNSGCESIPNSGNSSLGRLHIRACLPPVGQARRSLDSPVCAESPTYLQSPFARALYYRPSTNDTTVSVYSPTITYQRYQQLGQAGAGAVQVKTIDSAADIYGTSAAPPNAAGKLSSLHFPPRLCMTLGNKRVFKDVPTRPDVAACCYRQFTFCFS